MLDMLKSLIFNKEFYQVVDMDDPSIEKFDCIDQIYDEVET